MQLQIKDLPQADRFESVLAATVAVANGSTTDLEIADHVDGIHGDSRQGRYYRRAAEMLGFIRNEQNYATITERGAHVANNPSPTNPVVLEAVLNLNLYQKLLFHLEQASDGLNQHQLVEFLYSISTPGMGPTIIPRQISTILAWLRTLQVIEVNNGRYYLRNAAITNLPIIEFKDVKQPVLPHGDLREYETAKERASRAEDVLIMYRNQAKAERSHNSHRRLVNLVANRIKDSGAIAKSNQFIDLATTIDEDFIFEMKSTDPLNVRSQIRKGISQLYEYRFLQNKPDATLVLVLESPLVGSNEWYRDYIENDRNIFLVWDGNNQLYGSERSRHRLDFLGLQ